MIRSESMKPININNRTNCSKFAQPNFKGRKIAVAKPIINGIAKEIEIYAVGKKDAEFLQKTIGQTSIVELLPEMRGKMSANVWQNLINMAVDEIGHFSKQKCYIAVSNKKPCGIIVTNSSKSEGTLGILASIPIAVNEKVKCAGSSLMTAFLDMAKNKKLKKLKLEPILYGPSDTVAFYEKHNFKMVNPQDSTIMHATRYDINKTLEQNIKDLNYQKLRNQPETNLEHYLELAN